MEEWRYSWTILDLGTRWKWVVDFTPWSLYPQGKSPWYNSDRRLSGPQGRYGRSEIEKNPLPMPGIENPFSLSSTTPDRRNASKLSLWTKSVITDLKYKVSSKQFYIDVGCTDIFIFSVCVELRTITYISKLAGKFHQLFRSKYCLPKRILEKTVLKRDKLAVKVKINLPLRSCNTLYKFDTHWELSGKSHNLLCKLSYD
jgi:hypothetical protein